MQNAYETYLNAFDKNPSKLLQKAFKAKDLQELFEAHMEHYFPTGVREKHGDEFIQRLMGMASQIFYAGVQSGSVSLAKQLQKVNFPDVDGKIGMSLVYNSLQASQLMDKYDKSDPDKGENSFFLFLMSVVHMLSGKTEFIKKESCDCKHCMKRKEQEKKIDEGKVGEVLDELMNECPDEESKKEVQQMLKQKLNLTDEQLKGFKFVKVDPKTFDSLFEN